MTSIYRRELRSYYTGMYGFIFGAVFLLFAGISVTVINLNGSYPDFAYALNIPSYIILLIVPIVTMKCIAEEKRQKTDQLLYSLPLNISQIVMGKYLALCTVFALPLLILALYPLILSFFGTVNYGGSYSAMVGLFFLGASLMAIGMFISSLTESQVIAAVISFAVMFLIYLMKTLAALVPSSAGASLAAFSVLAALLILIVYSLTRDIWVSGSFGIGAEILILLVFYFRKDAFTGAFPALLSKLSVYDMYENFILGLFDIRAIVYYISVAFLFLFLTVQSLERKRYR